MTKVVAGIAAVLAVAAWASISEVTNTGIPLFRTDASAIQVLLNTSLQAGATNADGKTMITAGSDPSSAVTAAAAEWSAIPSALINFLPVQSTTLSNDPSDGRFVLTIQDTPANRSVVGSFLAITLYRFNNDGTITDSDVVFNPSVVQSGVLYPLSTDHSNGSYDLQSLVAHELGHSLGATHSPVISATMFQSQGSFSAFNTVTEVTLHQALWADDVAFATTRYPGPGAPGQLGSIAGKVAFSTGSAVMGALVLAVDPAKGTTIGGLASLTDGTYHLDSLPPGSYLVYAQPANGPVARTNISGVPNVNLANASFRVTFAGGNTSPSAVPVTAGQTSAADISVDPASPAMQVAFIGTGSAGGTDWTNIVGPKASAAGRALDLLLWGPGMNSTVTENQIRVIGPGIAMRAGTLRTSSVSQGFTSIRFTVDVAPATATYPVTVAVVKGTDAAVFSGGFVIAGKPVITGVVNGASFQPGIEAGSWVTIQGTNLANTDPGRTWRADEIVGGRLPTALDGVSVTINGKAAYVYYISPAQINVQAPTDGATGAVNVVVTNNGSVSAPATAQLQAFAPACFQYTGTSYAIATRYPDNALVGNPSTIPGTVAAAKGDVLILWATGFGPTNPATAGGSVVGGAPPVATLPAVTVGGTPVTMIGAALSPGSAGLYQIAIQLPTSLASGVAAIRASVGGFTSPAGVNLFVQ